MPSLVTFGSMVTAALQNAGMENVPVGAAFVSPSEVRARLNSSIARLYNMLVRARGQNYYRSAYTFTTSNGVGTYALPATHFETISVDINIGGPGPIGAKKFNEAERNLYQWVLGWGLGLPVPMYRLEGSNIHFIPTPTGAYSCTLNYVPAFTPFATDGTGDAGTFDGINGFEEWATWDTAEVLLAKEESDISYCMARKAQLEAEIKALAQERHAGASEKVKDVTLDGGWGWGWGSF